MKFMTSSEAEAKRQKAVEFRRRIGQDGEADRFDAMEAREYAEHNGAELRDNSPRRYVSMRNLKTRSELQAELEYANEYIEELESKLDNIAGIAAGDEEESVDEDEDED